MPTGFLESTTKPVLIGCYYKDRDSDLVVLAMGPREGVVIVPDGEGLWQVGEFSGDWPHFNDLTQWEYFIGEIVICNPTIPVDNSEVSDDTSSNGGDGD